MTTATFYPNALDVDPGSVWSYNGAADRVAAVNQSAVSSTRYAVSVATVPSVYDFYLWYGFDLSSIPDTARITGVRLYVVASLQTSANGWATLATYLSKKSSLIGGHDFSLSSWRPLQAYTDVSFVDNNYFNYGNTSPFTNSVWTKAELSDLVFGIEYPTPSRDAARGVPVDQNGYLSPFGTLGALRIHRVKMEVDYDTKPAITAITAAGDPNFVTNRPVISWTYTDDDNVPPGSTRVMLLDKQYADDLFPLFGTDVQGYYDALWSKAQSNALPTTNNPVVWFTDVGSASSMTPPKGAPTKRTYIIVVSAIEATWLASASQAYGPWATKNIYLNPPSPAAPILAVTADVPNGAVVVDISDSNNILDADSSSFTATLGTIQAGDATLSRVTPTAPIVAVDGTYTAKVSTTGTSPITVFNPQGVNAVRVTPGKEYTAQASIASATKSSGWRQSIMAGGGYQNCFDINLATGFAIIASDTGGVALSYNGAKSWRPFTNGLGARNVATCLVDRDPANVNTGYIGAGKASLISGMLTATGGGFYKWDNTNKVWVTKNSTIQFSGGNNQSPLPGRGHPRSNGKLLAKVLSGGTWYLFAASFHQGIGYSTDDGATWTFFTATRPSGIASDGTGTATSATKYARALEFDPVTGYLFASFFNDGAYVCKTPFSGVNATWTKLTGTDNSGYVEDFSVVTAPDVYTNVQETWLYMACDHQGVRYVRVDANVATNAWTILPVVSGYVGTLPPEDPNRDGPYWYSVLAVVDLEPSSFGYGSVTCFTSCFLPPNDLGSPWMLNNATEKPYYGTPNNRALATNIGYKSGTPVVSKYFNNNAADGTWWETDPGSTDTSMFNGNTAVYSSIVWGGNNAAASLLQQSPMSGKVFFCGRSGLWAYDTSAQVAWPSMKGVAGLICTRVVADQNHAGRALMTSSDWGVFSSSTLFQDEGVYQDLPVVALDSYGIAFDPSNDDLIVAAADTATNSGGKVWSQPSAPTWGTTPRSTAFVDEILWSGTVPYVDTFTRTTVSGWGTPDAGGAYTLSGGVNTNFSTDGSKGKIITAAGSTINARTGPTPLGSAGMVFSTTFSLSALPTGNWAATHFRLWVDGNNYISIRIRFQTNGKIGVQIDNMVSGALTTIVAEQNLGGSLGTYTPNTDINVKFAIDQGSTTRTLRAKVWKASEAEPTTWLIGDDPGGPSEVVATNTLVDPRVMVSVQGASGSSTPTFTYDNISCDLPGYSTDGAVPLGLICARNSGTRVLVAFCKASGIRRKVGTSGGFSAVTSTGGAFASGTASRASHDQISGTSGTMVVFDKNSGIYRSTDFGDNWTKIIDISSLTSFVASQQSGYVVIDRSNTSVLWVSTNRYIHKITNWITGTVIAGTATMVTYDLGATVTPGPLACATDGTITVVGLVSAANSYQATMWRTQDHGTTWTDVTDDVVKQELGYAYDMDILRSDNRLIICHNGAGCTIGGPGRQAKVGITFFDAAGTQIGSIVESTLENVNGLSWTDLLVSAVAPALSVYAGIVVTIPSPVGTVTTPDEFYLDALGISLGHLTPWSPGGNLGLSQAYVEQSTDNGLTWSKLSGRPLTATELLFDNGWHFTRSVQTGLIDEGIITYNADHTAQLTDYEAPLGTSLLYRAKAVDVIEPVTLSESGYTSAGPVTISTTDWWLKHRSNPSLSVPVSVVSDSGFQYTIPVLYETYEPVGRAGKVVDITAVQQAEFTFSMLFPNYAAYLKAEALYRSSSTLLLQSPAGRQWYGNIVNWTVNIALAKGHVTVDADFVTTGKDVLS